MGPLRQTSWNKKLASPVIMLLLPMIGYVLVMVGRTGNPDKNVLSNIRLFSPTFGQIIIKIFWATFKSWKFLSVSKNDIYKLSLHSVSQSNDMISIILRCLKKNKKQKENYTVPLHIMKTEFRYSYYFLACMDLNLQWWLWLLWDEGVLNHSFDS